MLCNDCELWKNVRNFWYVKIADLNHEGDSITKPQQYYCSMKPCHWLHREGNVSLQATTNPFLCTLYLSKSIHEKKSDSCNKYMKHDFYYSVTMSYIGVHLFTLNYHHMVLTTVGHQNPKKRINPTTQRLPLQMMSGVWDVEFPPSYSFERRLSIDCITLHLFTLSRMSVLRQG